MLVVARPLAAPQPDRRRGLSVVELIVVLAVVGFFGLIILTVLPRGRESARFSACQRNLMHIGLGVQLYAQAQRHYPITPPLGQAGDSTIRALLDGLTLPDFLDLHDPSTPPKSGQVPQPGTRVAGLVCPSDPHSDARAASTALSYRANAGDQPDASTGPFAAGILMTPARIEAANGLSYTAGFAERLLGTGRDGEPSPSNYQVVPGPVAGDAFGSAPPGIWRGDAGASWSESGWRSALYSHAQPANAPLTSLAADGRTANITASSSHPDRINVALLDGSLRSIRPTVAPDVWRRLGSTQITPDPTDEPKPTP